MRPFSNLPTTTETFVFTQSPGLRNEVKNRAVEGEDITADGLFKFVDRKIFKTLHLRRLWERRRGFVQGQLFLNIFSIHSL